MWRELAGSVLLAASCLIYAYRLSALGSLGPTFGQSCRASLGKQENCSIDKLLACKMLALVCRANVDANLSS